VVVQEDACMGLETDISVMHFPLCTWVGEKREILHGSQVCVGGGQKSATGWATAELVNCHCSRLE